ncbi:MAG: FAD-dependent oxidoreductase [Caldilineaceae bacterium]
MVVGELTTASEVVVLGAGEAGRAAALRAAQLGRQVALVDPRLPGDDLAEGASLFGETLRQALLTITARRWHGQKLAPLGLGATVAPINLAQLQAWKTGFLRRMAHQFSQQCADLQIEIKRGEAHFTGPNEVRIASEHGAERMHFDQCILAVAAQSAPLDAPTDDKRILTPAQATMLETMPAPLYVLGTTDAAIELSVLWARLGADVMLLIPSQVQLLAGFDEAVQPLLRRQLGDLHIAVQTLTQTASEWMAQLDAEACTVFCADNAPAIDELALDHAAVTLDEQGFVRVNESMQSSNPAVCAVGECVAPDLPSAAAIKQALVAAAHGAGRRVIYAPQAVPRLIQLDPAFGTVGLNRRAAQEAGYAANEVRLDLADILDAKPSPEAPPDGILLLTAEAESGVLLGATCVAPDAASILGEAALALEMGATLYDVQETLHPVISSLSALNEME